MLCCVFVFYSESGGGQRVWNRDFKGQIMSSEKITVAHYDPPKLQIYFFYHDMGTAVGAIPTHSESVWIAASLGAELTATEERVPWHSQPRQQYPFFPALFAIPATGPDVTEYYCMQCSTAIASTWR